MTVLVTGSAGGIGHACMAGFLQDGVDVRGLDIARGEALPGAKVGVVDVRDGMRFAAVLREGEGVHGLVSCASLPPTHPDPHEILETNFVALVDNLESLLSTSNAAASVVLFSSIAGFRREWPKPSFETYERTRSGRAVLDELLPRCELQGGYEGYCLSKRLVYDFTLRFAERAAAMGTRVNCLVLGPADTKGVHDMQRANPAAWTKLAAECPLGAPVGIAEVTKTVSLLVSPDMPHLTGARIFLDGGWSAARSQSVC